MTGHDLRKMRKLLGLTREQAAELLDVSISTYDRKERNRDPLPLMEQVAIPVIFQRYASAGNGGKSELEPSPAPWPEVVSWKR